MSQSAPLLLKTPAPNLPEFVKPKPAALQEFISYYYFLRSDDVDFRTEFYFYPHHKTTISVYQGAEVKWTDCVSEAFPCEEHKVNPYFSRIIRNRFNVISRGKFKKIGIVFNALGINQFIDCDLLELAPTQIVRFNRYGAEFEHVCEESFKAKTIEKQSEILDQFFLSKLERMRDDRIEKAVALFFKMEKNPSIEAVAQQMQIDRKTLYKLFKRHLGCSPSVFRRVIQFRKAIDQYMNQEEQIKLWELAYDNYFYDQSHFIRTTEELTDENPKQFFKGITRVGPQDTFWNFKD